MLYHHLGRKEYSCTRRLKGAYYIEASYRAKRFEASQDHAFDLTRFWTHYPAGNTPSYNKHLKVSGRLWRNRQSDIISNKFDLKIVVKNMYTERT